MSYNKTVTLKYSDGPDLMELELDKDSPIAARIIGLAAGEIELDHTLVDAGDLVDVLEYHNLAFNRNADGSHTGYLAQQEHKAHIETLEAAITRLSQGGWVKIEDVPQNIECIDVIINQDGLKYLDCTVEDGHWTYSDGHSGCRIKNPMFAILALPTPPQEEA